jgi:hypothetical protein
MKIVMFQYNRSVSAIIQENTLAAPPSKKRPVENCFMTNGHDDRLLTNGYEDRLLWEENAPLPPKKTTDFIILGCWQ